MARVCWRKTPIRDGSPSPSALHVAALRALHQSVDAPVVFADPLAVRILGHRAPALLDRYRATLGETARLRGTLAARHVIAEETVAAAVARGVRQCVIIGAGLDTFAYRHGHVGLQMFELDHPSTQAWKRGLLAEAGLAAPVRYVEADVERDDVFAALAAVGFDRVRPAVFVMLGLVGYLARRTLLRIFGEMARGDAELVIDYTEPFETAPEPTRSAYAAVAARLAAGGEPWITLFEPDDLHRELAALGFAEIDDRDADALRQRFCDGRTDDLSIAPLVHLLQARSRGTGGLPNDSAAKSVRSDPRP